MSSPWVVPCCLPADEVRKERKKQTKNDNLVRVASLLHDVSFFRVRLGFELRG